MCDLVYSKNGNCQGLISSQLILTVFNQSIVHTVILYTERNRELQVSVISLSHKVSKRVSLN